MSNPVKSTPPKNFYQAQPYTPPPMPAYPYNYLPNTHNSPPPNEQMYNPAYQYWNYYQYPPQNYYQQYQTNVQTPPYQQHRDQRNNQHNSGNKHHQNRNNNFQKNFNRNNGANDYNNRNFNNQQNKKSKNKIDKRDLPENNKFYCEVCDRGFKTDDKYQEHLATHTTCGVNGCKFTAAEKLVEIHYRNFHATGLDKKVANLQTPEELQKYINERKKNFPSQKNLEKKEHLDKEKSERGAVLDTKQFGRLKNRRNFDQNGRNAGTSKKNENENFDDEKNLSNSEKNPRNNNRKNLKRKNNKKSGLFARKCEVLRNRYKKPTLLQKLLADEIRHERNILLQCVRFVVQKNFFEKDRSSV